MDQQVTIDLTEALSDSQDASPRLNHNTRATATLQAQQQRQTDYQSSQARDNPMATPSLGLESQAAPLPAIQHTTKVTVADVGRYVELFEDVKLGSSSLYEPVRTLGLSPALDNVGTIKTNARGYVMSVYEALRAFPTGPDAHQGEMVTAFAKRLGEIKDVEVVLAKVSNVVVNCVIELHTVGDHLREDQIKHLKLWPEDRGMLAMKRMQVILRVLRDNKRVALDMLNGKDAVSAFVAGPMAAENRKAVNKKQNDTRKGKKTMQEAVDDDASATTAATQLNRGVSTTVPGMLQNQHPQTPTCPNTGANSFEPQPFSTPCISTDYSSQPPMRGASLYGNDRQQHGNPYGSNNAYHSTNEGLLYPYPPAAYAAPYADLGAIRGMSSDGGAAWLGSGYDGRGIRGMEVDGGLEEGGEDETMDL